MNRRLLDKLKAMMNIKPNERVVYAEDEKGFIIIKIVKDERHKNYRIIFDGKMFYLIKDKKVLGKNKNKNMLIPEGVAKVI